MAATAPATAPLTTGPHGGQVWEKVFHDFRSSPATADSLFAAVWKRGCRTRGTAEHGRARDKTGTLMPFRKHETALPPFVTWWCVNIRLFLSTQQITVNVSAFLSESGYIRQEVAASLRELSQRYDVFFLAVCTSVEVRVSARRTHAVKHTSMAGVVF